MTTEKQAAANKRNALKSTGPKTPRGKAIAKMNALKHGVLSSQVLIAGERAKEDLACIHRAVMTNRLLARLLLCSDPKEGSNA
jgi:hypothetical protein